MPEIIADHLKGKNIIKIYDLTSGFRVVIMTVANILVNTRVLGILPKFKTDKMKC